MFRNPDETADKDELGCKPTECSAGMDSHSSGELMPLKNLPPHEEPEASNEPNNACSLTCIGNYRVDKWCARSGYNEK